MASPKQLDLPSSQGSKPSNLPFQEAAVSSTVTSRPLLKHDDLVILLSCTNFLSITSHVVCQLGDSPSDEHISPIVSADWRSFRANLVAAQKQSMPGRPISSALPATDVGDKWAHPIYEPERGCLLIATEKLDGVHIFERTVILIMATGPLGPTGLILNRPSLMSIKETNSTVLDESRTFLDRPLYFGGPLEEGLFLVSSPSEEGGVGTSGVFDEVMKGLYYGTRESVGCAAEMVKRGMIGMNDIRFFDGYCGWEKEQLQDEIRAGYWNLAACSHSVIGLETVNSGGMWEEVLGLMGSKKVW
ncbi:hypothetical protein KSS87_006503 [Heliosperma pusillum]|nr:hypothetical protein KSS87_018419 [Heliosperma pusillum]KAH9617531.1 hypothetical protein KSS87_006503 [Heliosperma pusillum]